MYISVQQQQQQQQQQGLQHCI